MSDDTGNAHFATSDNRETAPVDEPPALAPEQQHEPVASPENDAVAHEVNPPEQQVVERGSTEEGPDLGVIEADLDDVQAALTRLADGTYWTDEVTGATIGDDVLAAEPLARRV